MTASVALVKGPAPAVGGNSAGAEQRLLVSPSLRRWWFGVLSVEPPIHPLSNVFPLPCVDADPGCNPIRDPADLLPGCSVTSASRAALCHGQNMTEIVANDERREGWGKPPNG